MALAAAPIAARAQPAPSPISIAVENLLSTDIPITGQVTQQIDKTTGQLQPASGSLTAN